ncbi:MAG: hypothetical protein ACOYD9_02975 [Pyramidobacter sp.]|jgi:hypothetical protein
MKKFLIGIFVLVAGAVIALCTLDIGTEWIARKGAEYVANTYNLGVSIGGARGNPVKGYTFTDLELTRDGASLIKAGKIFVDPALLAMIKGNFALDWVELSDIKSTVPHLLQLTEIFTGQKVVLPQGISLNDLTLNSVGGRLDGATAEAALDIVLNGLPLKGDFNVDLSSGVALEKADVELCGGTVKASGAIMPALDLKVAAKKLQIADLGVLVPQIDSFAAKGLAGADLTVAGALENPTVHGTAQFSDGSVMGFPLSGKATASLEGNVLALDPLSVNALGIPTAGSVFADLTGKTPKLKVLMKTSGPVTADTLRKNLPSLPLDLGGQVDSVNVAVEGPVTALKGSAKLGAAKLLLDGQPITDTLLKADFNSKGLITLSGGSKIMGNPATLKGTVDASGKETAADVAFGVTDFDLAMLPKLIPSAPENIKGKVSASFTVKGKGKAMTTGGKVTSKQVLLNDMRLSNIAVPLTFKGDTLTFKDASLVFMDLPITKVNGAVTLASDNVAFKQMSAAIAGGRFTMDSTLKLGKKLNGIYDLKAVNVDLANVMKTFGAEALNASGKLSAAIQGTLTDTDITGKGAASIPLFTMTGLKFEQVTSSIALSKMIASLPDFTCRFAQGTLTGSMNVDINKMSYNLKAAMKGSQLKSIIDQVMPTLGGGLTGTLTGNYSASGKLSPFTLAGEGLLSSAGGQMYGFKKYDKIIKVLSQLHGNKGTITYANAAVPFSTSATELTFKDGTVVNALPDDGIYRSIKALGTFAYSGALDMDVDALINTMLVDTAASALSGATAAGGAAALLTGGAGGIAGLAVGALTGASKSFGKADFRNLTFHVGGTADSPKLENFKVNGAKWTGKTSPEGTEEKAAGDKTPTTGDLQKTLDEKLNTELNRTTDKLLGIKRPAGETQPNVKKAPADVETNKSQQEPEPEKPLTKEDIKKQIQDATTDALNRELQKLLGKSKR